MTAARYAWSFDGAGWRALGDAALDPTTAPGAVTLVAPATPSVPRARSVTLEQLVLASLFTDAPVPSQGGGWWADAFDKGQGNDRGPVGSRLWTRRGRGLTDELVELIRTDAVEALDWMARAGVALPTVEVTRPTARAMQLAVGLERPPIPSSRYAYLWR